MDLRFWHILLHHLQTVLSVHQFFPSLTAPFLKTGVITARFQSSGTSDRPTESNCVKAKDSGSAKQIAILKE